MPYDPTNSFSPEGQNLRNFLRSQQESNRAQKQQRREEQRQTEMRKAEVYQDNFVFRLDKTNDDDKEIAIVIPADKLPESLRDYKNMSQEEIRQRVGALLADESSRSALQNGQFFIDGRPATSADKAQIYSSVRETVLNMAKSGVISVGGYSSQTLGRMPGFFLNNSFDAGYKTQLDAMIARMINNNGNGVQIAALTGNRGR